MRNNHNHTAEYKAINSQFLGTYFMDLSAYCTRRLVRDLNSTMEDAKDIFMEAMLSISEKMWAGEQQEIANPSAYLFGICRNILRKKWRHQQKEREQRKDVALNFYQTDSNFDKLELAEIQAENSQAKTIQTEMLNHTFLQLSAKSQEILSLYYIERKSMKEIAKIMGLANANVAKTMKSRSFQKWRFLIELHTNKYQYYDEQKRQGSRRAISNQGIIARRSENF